MNATNLILESVCRDTGMPIEKITGPLAGQCVQLAWLSGSLVEGLGNASSDLDVFAVVPALTDDLPSIRRSEDHFVQVYYSNSRRIDFEYWSENAISELEAKLRNAPVGDSTKSILDYFAEHEIEFMHRLHIGVPIVGADALADLQRRFDRSRLLAYLVENKRIYADDAFDDTVGLMQEGALLSAAQRARCTLDFSADMVLYAHGISNHKDKHRYRLFLRLLERYPDLRPSCQDYLALIRNQPTDFVDLQAYVAKCLSFSEELVYRATCKYLELTHA